MTDVELHKQICTELTDLYKQKNHDYGNSFQDSIDKFGIVAAAVRINDKTNRLCTLCTKSEYERQVKNETISDTFIDLANYCILAEMALRKEQMRMKDDSIIIAIDGQGNTEVLEGRC